MQKIGLALGGGGAKGLAHIALLEVLDEFGIRPHCIAGTSIGAVIGVLYASGHPAREIREQIERFSFKDGEGLGDLQIPLRVVAADFWQREQVVLESGELKPAIQASMALPGVFNPVVLGKQVLVDGGAVNPVPFDLLDDCDLVIAVNVMGTRTESADLVPSMTEAVFNTFQIMQASILRHKLRHNPPDIFISPDIVDIQMLEFYKSGQVFQQAQSACEELRQRLTQLGFRQPTTFPSPVSG
jgi:NTE family protein